MVFYFLLLGTGFTRMLTFSPGSFVLTGLAESAAIPILGIKIEELNLDEKAELLLLDQKYLNCLSSVFAICG